MADITIDVKLTLTDAQVEEVMDALSPQSTLRSYIEFKYLKARGGLPRQEGRLQVELPDTETLEELGVYI